MAATPHITVEIRAVACKQFDVVLRHHGARANTPCAMALYRVAISDAITLTAQTAQQEGVTAWITCAALEQWITELDPFDGYASDDPSEGWLDRTEALVDLAAAAARLTQRVASRPLPLAVAQVIEAYLLANEHLLLGAFLTSLTPATLIALVHEARDATRA